jgi:Methylase involved in ubiquinone/menaquinone biosynthesis
MPWNYSFLKRHKVHTGIASEERIVLPPITKERRFRKDVPYILPKDTGEIDRLDIQHHIIRTVLKGNYVAPIETPARILDVGCGTGQWAFDMCQQFPQAQVIGADLEPGKKAPPDNFIFVQANILTSFPFDDLSFDYVHQRFLIAALPLKNWPQILNELARITIPGGWVELIEGSDEITPSGPAMRRMIDILTAFAQKRGLNTSSNVPRFLDSLLTQAGLQNATMKTFDVPLGPWGGQIGEMMATNLYNAFSGMCTIVPATLNIPQSQVTETLSHLRDEWEQDRATYRYYLAYAQKSAEQPTEILHEL